MSDEEDGDEDARHRAGIVHHAQDSEIPSPVLAGGDIGEDGVARRAAHLAAAIQQAEGDHPLPGEGDGIAGVRDAAQEIARPDEDFALADAVGNVAGDGLGDGDDGIPETVDQSDDLHVRAEHAREEERPDGEDHVGAGVVEEGGDREDADGPPRLSLVDGVGIHVGGVYRNGK